MSRSPMTHSGPLLEEPAPARPVAARRRRAPVGAVLVAAAVMAGLGVAVVAPTPAGATSGWSARTNIDTSGLTGASCPTASSCTAVDPTGRVLTYNGTHWSAPTTVDSGTMLNAVSCPTTSFCAAVDDAGNALVDTGAWSAPSLIDASNTMVGLSCANATFCVAVDEENNALVYDGSTWSSPTSIDSAGRQLTAVSCATASFCVATDNNQDVIVYDGAWQPATQISGAIGFRGVSCPTASFCAAVDSAGDVTFYNGSTWSTASLIDGSNRALASVSCANASFCAAVDVAGNALTFDGTSWSSPTMVDSSNTFTTVSCPSSSFCAAVDSEGYVVTYVPSQLSGFHITTSSPLPAATRGHAYSDTLHATGGRAPYRWKRIGHLPRGLKLHPSGVLSGTPQSSDTPGTYTYTARAKTHRARHHPAQSTTMIFTITLS